MREYGSDTFNAGTTLYTVSSLRHFRTLLSRSIDKIAFVNDKICILKVIGRVWEKSMKYNSTTEIQIRALRLGKAMRM